MKKLVPILIAILAFNFVDAQQEKGITGSNNLLVGWSAIKPNKIDYSETTKILYGTINTNYKLSSSETYLLQGKVYITNNSTLTIEPGTIIRGDSETGGTLIITKGSKIIAEGVQNSPIVFTSNKAMNERKPGDWGGIILMGDAPVNSFGGVSNIDYDIDSQYRSYGGANVQNDAGSLKYVRIEFAGYSPDRKKNFNAFTTCGVGDKTKIEYVQVSNSLGNSFKFFGGNINAANLFSYRARNDDYNFTQGVQTNLNNCIAIRNAFISSSEDARCMNIKSYDKKEMTDFSKKMSNVVAENFTLVNESDGDKSAEGIIREAIYINTDVTFTMKNSVVSGFTAAVLFNAEIEIKDANLRKVDLKGVFMNNCKANIQSEIGGATDGDLEEFYSGTGPTKNVYSKTSMQDMFVSPKNDKTPDLRLKINKIN